MGAQAPLPQELHEKMRKGGGRRRGKKGDKKKKKKKKGWLEEGEGR
jgi:hypothetical protein